MRAPAGGGALALLLAASVLLAWFAAPAAAIKAHSYAWSHVLNEKPVLVRTAGPCPCLVSYFVEASPFSVRAALVLLSSGAYEKFVAGQLRPDEPGQETVVVESSGTLARAEDFRQAAVPDGEHLFVVLAPLATGYIPVRVLVDIVPADGGSVTLPPGQALVLSSARACPCAAANQLATDADPKDLVVAFLDDDGLAAALGGSGGGAVAPVAGFFPSGAAHSAPADAAAVRRVRERALKGAAGTVGQRMHVVLANLSPRPTAVQVALAMAGSHPPEVEFATGAPTSGGPVAIVGRHFGSRQDLLGQITIGGRPCASPQLLLPGHLLRCDAAPGTGFALDVSVTVAGMSSGATGRRRFWYDGPYVSNVTSAPPTGGTVTMRGGNLGAGGTGGEVATWIGGRRCTNARVSVPHSEIVCEAPPGTGSGLDAVVRVGGRPADFDGAGAFAYGLYPPAKSAADGRRWAVLVSDDPAGDSTAASAAGWRARAVPRASSSPERVREAVLEAAKGGAEVVFVGDAPAAAALLRAGLPLQPPGALYPFLVSSNRGADAGPHWIDAEGYAGARSRTGTPSRVWAVRGEEGTRLRFPVQSFPAPAPASNVSRHPSLGPFAVSYPYVARLGPGGTAFLWEALWALPAAPAAGGGSAAALWAQRLLAEVEGGTLIVPSTPDDGAPVGVRAPEAEPCTPEALSAGAAAAAEWRRGGRPFEAAAASLAAALASAGAWPEADAAAAAAWPLLPPLLLRLRRVSLRRGLRPRPRPRLPSPSSYPSPPPAPSSPHPAPFFSGPAFLRPPLRPPPFVSFVIGTRNDNYGGSLHRRLQVFVDMLAGLCDRHAIEAELIAVEWNPPMDRVPLAQAFTWPRPSSRLAVRIVTVPPEVHFTYENSRRTPHFEYISKNAGIRRARGQYIFATNQDVILSRGMGELLGSRALDPESYYMSRRFDLPAAIPPGLPYDQAMQVAEGQGIAHLVVFSGEPRMVFGDYADPDWGPRLAADPQTKGGLQEPVRVARYAQITRDKVGDMLLMHRAIWERLRAYPELPTNSAIEMRLPANAAAVGYKYVMLRPPYAIFHQDHEHQRWDRPVSDLPWDDLERVVQGGRAENANGPDWGLAGHDLSEAQLA
eukprot:tig00020572_g11541.t1